MELKTAELAKLLGLSVRRVNQLAKDGIAIKTAPGRFDGPKSIANFIESKTIGDDAKAAALDLNAEKARLAKLQADGHEIKNAALRGDLVEAEAVAREWADILRRVRAGIMAVPSRVRSRNPALSATDIETMYRELRDALEALSNEHTTDDGEGDESPPAAAEDAA
ncbi:terminase small subunit [Jiella sp. M17.18]|uniref:terminase small subunit n=1 Tax=Jiella sp. M17.18 TaxID=3234247 RepID=UPI0034DE5B04